MKPLGSFALCASLCVAGCATTTHKFVLYPERPQPARGAPSADPLPSRIVVHVTVARTATHDHLPPPQSRNLPVTVYRPAVIVGMPVGFVGAVESKEALIADSRGIPYVSVRGRIGGSAMAAAAINALARVGL